MREEWDASYFSNGKLFYQEKEGFRYGSDALLLADFIVEEAQEGKRNLEIGTGNGILPVLLSQQAFVSKEYMALDILESNIELARENWKENEVEVESLCEDVRKYAKKNYYQQIFVNPPYMKVDGKLQNKNSSKAVARHEIELSLEELIQTSKKLLAPVGRLYMVYRSHRLQELLALLTKYDFSLAKLAFVYHESATLSNLVLVEAHKGRKTGAKILKARYIK